MARFKTDGLDDIFKDMEAHAELTGETADKMLLAGAEVVKQEWKKSAERHNHRVTGDMISSITYPKKTQNIRDIKSIDIYPQGKDRKGIRNAEKAFILNYGTTKIAGSHWIDEADAASETPVYNVMEKIWNEYLEKNGGN